jgi:hypothetical protein
MLLRYATRTNSAGRLERGENNERERRIENDGRKEDREGVQRRTGGRTIENGERKEDREG